MKLEKITKRRYDDACGTAHGLELIGERWALLIVRELMLGALRFSDLKAALPGISANVLTQRLEGLEAHGLVIRKRLAPPASVQVYELTPWGYDAEPIIQTLGRWAARSPHHDPTLPFSGVSMILSFRTNFSPARAEYLNARFAFVTGERRYWASVSRRILASGRGDIDEPDVTFTAAPEIMAAAVYGGQPLADLIAAGALRVDGDIRLAQRFTGLFVLPPKAPALHPA